MDPVVERCAGIDIGKAQLKACVRVPGKRAGTVRKEVRSFSTTTAGLLKLREWLVAERVELVAMESTGQYWRSVYYLLEEVVECWLVNPAHIKVVPGRKSDVSDAAWIAQLTQHGLLRPSFVPPPPIRRLRDLTRLRTNLVRERARHSQRIQDVLEDAGIKLAVVASDVLGVSGRRMITALIGGERDPEALADLALGRMRVKNQALTEALTGRFGDHHAFQCQLLLDQIDGLEAGIARLDDQIEAEIDSGSTGPDGTGARFRDLVTRLDTIPGIATRTAEVILAETGGDMTRFATPAHLASWAGMCPGNNESAGKHGSTKTRKGDVWLRAALGEAANGAARTKHTHLGERHRQLAARRGRNRATIATGRVILETAWWIMRSDDAVYTELGPDHRLRRHRDPHRRANKIIQELEALGYDVSIKAVPA